MQTFPFPRCLNPKSLSHKIVNIKNISVSRTDILIFLFTSNMSFVSSILFRSLFVLPSDPFVDSFSLEFLAESSCSLFTWNFFHLKKFSEKFSLLLDFGSRIFSLPSFVLFISFILWCWFSKIFATRLNIRFSGQHIFSAVSANIQLIVRPFRLKKILFLGLNGILWHENLLGSAKND